MKLHHMAILALFSVLVFSCDPMGSIDPKEAAKALSQASSSLGGSGTPSALMALPRGSLDLGSKTTYEGPNGGTITTDLTVNVLNGMAMEGTISFAGVKSEVDGELYTLDGTLNLTMTSTSSVNFETMSVSVTMTMSQTGTITITKGTISSDMTFDVDLSMALSVAGDVVTGTATTTGTVGGVSVNEVITL